MTARRTMAIWAVATAMVATVATAQTATITMDGNQLVLPSPVVFKPGTAEMDRSSLAGLAVLKAHLDDKTYLTLIRVEAHTATTDTAGQTLSEARALTVARRLVTMGVACNRIIAVGFGGTKPVVAPTAPDAATTNDRIEIHAASLRDHLIGGMPADGGGNVAGTVCP